ncbi:hypothetical protein BGZ93_002436 [Podila epicladia]|nr:hypothetical protein BGZ92_001348 [Podila epicladia]KAG0082454.1 hypothetical protein BGZ93_002436 [Podila epicladia]
MRLLRRPSEYWLAPGRLTPQQQLDAFNDPGNWPSDQQVREQAYKEYREAYPLSRLPFIGPSRSHFDRLSTDSPVLARTRLRMRRAAALLPVDGILAPCDEHGISGESEGALSRYRDDRTLPVEDSFSRYQRQEVIVLADGGISRYEEQSRVVPAENGPSHGGGPRLARRKNKPSFFKRIWNRVSRKVDVQEAIPSRPEDAPALHRRG